MEGWSLAAALLAIAALAVGWLTTADEPHRQTARMITSTLAVGSVIAAVTQVAYLGAEDRVLAVGDLREFDPAPLATMIDAIGRTDDYVENLGFLLMAVALAAMALVPTSNSLVDRALRVACWALSAGLVLTVVTSFAAAGANDVVLLAVGAVLGPVWVLLLARRLARRTG